MPTLPDNITSVLNAISCSSANACTAVGYKQFGSTKHPLVQRWNGTNWHGQALPTLPDNGVLIGVSCPSDTACGVSGYIDGQAGRIALRWDGAWSKQTTPIPNHDRAKFAAFHNITCTSANRCTAVGQFSIYEPVCCDYTVHPLVEKVERQEPDGSEFDAAGDE